MNPNSKKQALLKANRIPGQRKFGRKKPLNILNATNKITNSFTTTEIHDMFAKASYPCCVDFSGVQYQLESDEFLLECPNCLKEYCINMI
jgi:hypothetical protein